MPRDGSGALRGRFPTIPAGRAELFSLTFEPHDP